MKQERVISSSDFNQQAKWLSAINRRWEKSYKNGAAPLLNKDKLIRIARRKTGLNDLGKYFWDEPFDRLLDSYNHEARLHPIGNFITGKRLMNLLTVRLRAEHWFKKFPEILEQELYPPIIIAGLQRTGTTKLHRLLTADPNNRVLRSWEALNPAPFKLNARKDKRIRIARTSEKALRLMTPGFFAIHPVEHLAPEEDILLLDVSFLSTTPEATSHVPSYSKWLEETDQSLAYEYGSRLLRLLQWQKPARNWVLKSPHHLEFLHLVEKYYGNPHFIWPHRDPAECIPSFLSMVCHSRALFSDEVRINDVSEHWVAKTAYMLNKALSYRQEKNHALNFTDILYEELVRDPMGQLEKIYERHGGINDSLAQKFQMAEVKNPKGKYGSHHYKLRDFGLGREDLIRKNTTYYELFTSLKPSKHIKI